MERSTFFLIGKLSINGPFSMAMLKNQRVLLNLFILGLPLMVAWMGHWRLDILDSGHLYASLIPSPGGVFSTMDSR